MKVWKYKYFLHVCSKNLFSIIQKVQMIDREKFFARSDSKKTWVLLPTNTKSWLESQCGSTFLQDNISHVYLLYLFVMNTNNLLMLSFLWSSLNIFPMIKIARNILTVCYMFHLYFLKIETSSQRSRFSFDPTRDFVLLV